MESCSRYFLKFLFILLVGLSGCQKSASESDSFSKRTKKRYKPIKRDLEQIKKRGVLVAVVDNSSTGYFVYKGQPMGFEYELLSLLAEELGVKLETKLTTSIDEAFEMLNNGEGDVLAYSLTITKERKEWVSFASSQFTARQVLVQKKPDNWRELTKDQIEKKLLRNQVKLIGKEVHVRKSSSFVDRLYNLSDEIGGDIIIYEEPDTVETEALIKRVAQGDIKYTVADETVARVNAAYFANVDVKTPISFPQQIAWAVRKNSPDLLKAINSWMKKVKRKPTFNVIYNRYYNSPRTSRLRAKSEFSSFSGDKISPFDDLVKESAEIVGWDWRLLVAQMYRESRFDPRAKSWAGAHGLMQLLPETGRRFGARNLYNPEENIKAAVKYLDYLDSLWAKTIEDEEERIKFVLASYNVGLGHVVDARNLAKKYDADPLKWEANVAKYLRLKSKEAYFTDPIVTSGYCRGDEPVNYVIEILSYYDLYKQLINS